MAEHPDWYYHKETERLNDFVECKTSQQEQKPCCESLCAIDHLILGVSPNPKCCSLAVLLLNQEQCELHPSMPGKNAPSPDITVTHQPWLQVFLMNPIISCHYACRLTQAHIETHKHAKKFFCTCICSPLTYLFNAPLPALFHTVTHLQLTCFFLLFSLYLSAVSSPWPLISYSTGTHGHISSFSGQCFTFQTHIFLSFYLFQA